MDLLAGLVTEMKGDTIPMGPDGVNMTIREPLGVVARILAFNHPLTLCGGKGAAPNALWPVDFVREPFAQVH